MRKVFALVLRIVIRDRRQLIRERESQPRGFDAARRRTDQAVRDVIPEVHSCLRIEGSVDVIPEIFAEILLDPSSVRQQRTQRRAALYGWKETKGLLGVSWRTLTGSATVVQAALYMNRYSRASGLGEAYPDRPIDGGRSIASRPDILHTDESETPIGRARHARAEYAHGFDRSGRSITR